MFGMFSIKVEDVRLFTRFTWIAGATQWFTFVYCIHVAEKRFGTVH